MIQHSTHNFVWHRIRYSCGLSPSSLINFIHRNYIICGGIFSLYALGFCPNQVVCCICISATNTNKQSKMNKKEILLNHIMLWYCGTSPNILTRKHSSRLFYLHLQVTVASCGETTYVNLPSSQFPGVCNGSCLQSPLVHQPIDMACILEISSQVNKLIMKKCNEIKLVILPYWWFI